MSTHIFIANVLEVALRPHSKLYCKRTRHFEYARSEGSITLDYRCVMLTVRVQVHSITLAVKLRVHSITLSEGSLTEETYMCISQQRRHVRMYVHVVSDA